MCIGWSAVILQYSNTAVCTVNIQNESTVILQQLLLAAKVPATFAVFLQWLLLFNSSCDR